MPAVGIRLGCQRGAYRGNFSPPISPPLFSPRTVVLNPCVPWVCEWAIEDLNL